MQYVLACALALTGLNGLLHALGAGSAVPPPPPHHERIYARATEAPVATSSPRLATSTLVFVGDLMFDRYIRERAGVMGYSAILQEVCATTREADLTVGNLEGPVTSHKPVSSYREGGPNHYTFTFASTSLDALAACGFDALSLANNHILNFGSDGVRETREHVTTRGLDFFGDPASPYEPSYKETPAGGVALFGYNEFGSNDPHMLAERLRKEATSTFVVVMPHWGEEYDTVANERERALAHLWVDAGADLVVGAHPHVVQDTEVYHGAPIHYSLGNFVFDQYFSEEVRCGHILTVEYSQHGVVTRTDESLLMRDGRTARGPCGTSIQELLNGV